MFNRFKYPKTIGFNVEPIEPEAVTKPFPIPEALEGKS